MGQPPVPEGRSRRTAVYARERDPQDAKALRIRADARVLGATLLAGTTVTHEDSAGNIGRTVAGDVQVISAGTGISHSERNLGEAPLKLFQIWLLPLQRGGTPHWDNRRFPKADRAGRLITLASGGPQDVDALQIRADARVLGATLLAGTTVTHPLGRFRYSYLAPAQGVILVNGQRVVVGDGIAVVDEPKLNITAEEDAEFILVDAA